VTVPRFPAMRRYGLALLSTGVAFAVRWLLNPALGGAGVFLPFICAIVVSSWYGGLGPGLLATGVGASLGFYAFLPPQWSWTVETISGPVYLALFLVTGAAISVLQAQLHGARRRAEAEAAKRKGTEEALHRAHQELEQRVVERTSQLTAVNAELRTEIIERQRAEKQLRQSEERWRAVFGNSAVGIAMSNFDGRFLAANAAYQDMLGYSEAELRALSWMDVTHEDDRGANSGLVTELLEGQRQSFVLVTRNRRKDGHVMWVHVHASLVPGTEGIAGFIIELIASFANGPNLLSDVEKSGCSGTHQPSSHEARPS
jgi:PAS domain S-box-containing protein